MPDINKRSWIPTDVLEWLDEQIEWFLGGSSVLLKENQGQDLDIAVLVENWASWELRSDMRSLGFKEREMFMVNGEDVDYNVGGNRLYERKDIDLIILDDGYRYQSWKDAALIVAELGLTNRADRLKVHHILLKRQSYVIQNPLTSGGILTVECFDDVFGI